MRGKSIFLQIPYCYTHLADLASSHATFGAFLSSTETSPPAVSGNRHTTSQGPFDRLRRSRQRLGSKRHDLLVALRIINGIEREMVDAEWESWLEDENIKCKQISILLQENGTESFGGEVSYKLGGQKLSGTSHPNRTQIGSWHAAYCGSCAQEKEFLVAKQMGSIER